MKSVNNSSETASPRGGVGSIVRRTQSTATQVNTIRLKTWTSPRVNGEVLFEKVPVASSEESSSLEHGGIDDAFWVVGGSRLSRGRVREDGNRSGDSRRRSLKMAGKVRSVKTLGMAWEAVRTSAGAAGVDRISVGFFEKDSQQRLLAVNERLANNNYRPQAIRRVYIPKAGSSETRPLGIPTVTDRVVQAALKMVMEPIFESGFADSSYG